MSISGAPFIAIDSDADSGFGGYGPHGVQISLQVMSNPVFGKALSPGDPILMHKTSIDEVCSSTSLLGRPLDNST